MHRRPVLAAALAAVTLPARWALAGDPALDPTLAAVLGEWRGTMTTRDAIRPERAIVLPARLYVAAVAPDELALHYVYGGGTAGSTYGYERLRFDFASSTLIWISGAAERTALVGRIVSSADDAGGKRYVVDTTKDRALTRYTFEFGPSRMGLKKDDVDAAGNAVNRSFQVFTRGG